jgi:hypothetical protein
MQIAMNFYMRCVHGHLGKIPMVIPAIIFIVIIIATVCLSGSMYFDRKDIANWSKITNDGRYYTIVNPHTADKTDDEVYDSVRDEDLTFFTARTLVAAFGVGVEDQLDNTYQFFSMTFQRLQYEIHFYLNVMLILLFLFSLIRLGIILALHLKMRITVYRARASCFSGESACSNCKTIYSLEYWPYECSMCGDHHCVKCASQTRMLVGASKESRVCNKCYGIANPWANATIPNVARELFASIAHAYFDKYCSASVGGKEERRGAKALRQHDFVSRVRATWGLFWPAGMEAIVKDSYVWLVANTNIELDDEEATLKLYDNGHVPTQWKRAPRECCGEHRWRTISAQRRAKISELGLLVATRGGNGNRTFLMRKEVQLLARRLSLRWGKRRQSHQSRSAGSPTAAGPATHIADATSRRCRRCERTSSSAISPRSRCRRRQSSLPPLARSPSLRRRATSWGRRR